MSVIVAERIFIRAPEVILWVGVPAALWAVIVGAFVYSGKWRRFAFGAAVLVGGIGLIWGVGGLTIEISDDGGLGAYGRGIGAAIAILFGVALLLDGGAHRVCRPLSGARQGRFRAEFNREAHRRSTKVGRLGRFQRTRGSGV